VSRSVSLFIEPLLLEDWRTAILYLTE